MSFQILDKENNPIDINILDKEACELWDKTYDDKSYASPAKKKEGESAIDFMRRDMTNWYDIIGYQIHNPNTNYTSGWDNIKASIWSIQSTGYYKHLFDTKQYKDENGKLWTELDIALEATKQFI